MLEECPRCRILGIERQFTNMNEYEQHITNHELSVLNKSLEKLIGWFLESSKRYIDQTDTLR